MSAEPRVPGVFTFQLNPKLDPIKLQDEFQRRGRVRIHNFLTPESADDLYQHLAHRVAWRTFVVAEEQLLVTPVGETVGTTPAEDSEVINLACEGARKGFARVFDAERSFADEVSGEPAECQEQPDAMLLGCETLFASSEVRDLLRSITGLAEIAEVRTQSQRFRPGHFVTFHCGTWSADRSGKRRAMFYLNLTPEWKPEWGGMLEFRNREGDTIEACMPSFNTLDLISFPQGHWVSQVANFANGPALMIAGRIYVP